MRPVMMRSVVVFVVFARAAFAGSSVIVDTFEDGNPNGWDWGLGVAEESFIEPSEGNPGAHLKTFDFVLNAAAWFSSGPDFTGDFVAKGVTSLGADLLSEQGDPNNEVIYIGMVNFGPTSSPFDDIIAQFNTGIASPDFPDDGWVSVDVPLDVDAVETPAGWELVTPFGAPSDAMWSEVVQDVEVVAFGYGPLAGPVLLFDVTRGLDNPRIAFIPAPGVAMPPAAAGLVALGARRRRGVDELRVS